ncbi:hypothetical protein N2152v2_003374 [Parachlorella kessleri]
MTDTGAQAQAQLSPEQYQQALKDTQPITFAGAAATVAASPSVGVVADPTLTDIILCDHSSTLTLFNHFFQAAQAGATNIMEMVLGALALDLRLHSQAEMQVLYPILAERLGDSGAAWAQRSLQEHAMVEQSIADCLALRADPTNEALVTRVKQMQQEFMAHQQEEEQIILPALVTALTPEELVSLATTFKAVKQTAPLLPQTPAVQAAMAAAAAAPADTDDVIVADKAGEQAAAREDVIRVED